MFSHPFYLLQVVLNMAGCNICCLYQKFTKILNEP